MVSGKDNDIRSKEMEIWFSLFLDGWFKESRWNPQAISPSQVDYHLHMRHYLGYNYNVLFLSTVCLDAQWDFIWLWANIIGIETDSYAQVSLLIFSTHIRPQKVNGLFLVQHFPKLNAHTRRQNKKEKNKNNTVILANTLCIQCTGLVHVLGVNKQFSQVKKQKYVCFTILGRLLWSKCEK